MMRSRLILLALGASLLVFGLTTCGSKGGDDGSGDGGSPATPPPTLSLDVAGTWSTTERVDATECERVCYSESKSYSISQSGDNLTVTPQGGAVQFSGTVSGTQVSWGGSYAEDGGTMSVQSLSLTVSADRNSFDGSSSWTWSGGGATCSGATQVAGIRGGSGTWTGTKQLGTTSADSGYGVAVDSSGNVYVTGYTAGDLGGNPNPKVTDIILVKYNSAGTKQWIRQLSTGLLDWGYGVAVDSRGNAYIAGYVEGGLDGNTSAGGSDVFLVKFDADGTKQWTRQLGTASGDSGRAVAVDSSGNVYVTGSTRGGLDGNANVGNEDIFLVKFDSDGGKKWTQQLGTGSSDTGWGVAVDSSGNAYVTGMTSGGLDGNTNAGLGDIFLAKYDSDGARKWTRQLGTKSDDRGYGVAVDSSGNVYVTGYTGGGYYIDPRYGHSDIFLAKFDSAGTKQWSQQLGTTSSDDTGYGVAVDNGGNIYVTGYAGDSLEGDPSVVGSHIFLVKYDLDGTKKWTRQMGTGPNDTGRGIAVDSNGDIYVTGYTWGDLDGNTSAGYNDIFLAKYNSDGVKQ